MGIDYLTTYLPENYYKHQLQLIVGNWFITGLFFVIGFIVSAYLVQREDQKEIAKLSERITELENRQPILEVGFLDKRNDLDKNLQIHLSKISDPPNYEELLIRKRRELLAKMEKYLVDDKRFEENPFLKMSLSSFLGQKINPNYASDIEKFLENEYRQYLVHLCELETIKNRAIFITPIIKNIGGHPATEVTIEFMMPESYQEPTEEQYLDSRLHYHGYLGPSEYAPPPPKEPGVTVKPLDHILTEISIPNLSIPIPTSQQVFEPSNTAGPNHQVKNGRDIITYSVKRLVQQRSEDNFEPFLLWLEGLNESTPWEIGVNIYCAEFINSPKTDTLYIDFIVDQG